MSPTTEDFTSANQPELTITRGRCYALFAYDIGMHIDLDEADRRIMETTQREKIRHRRRAPKYFDYKPAPLRVTQPSGSLPLGGFDTSTTVDLVLYDFGAVLVVYTIPITGPLDGLLPMADTLYENQDLQADSRARVERLAELIHSAVALPLFTETAEDYITYVIEQFDCAAPLSQVIDRNAPLLAQILRSETQTLAEQEIGDAMQCKISFTPNDVTLIDWNASLIFDPDADDVLAVLEYANVELLEMRFLDQKLDDALDQAYRALNQPRRPVWTFRGSGDSDLALVSQLQVDSAVLFEGVNNALKLLGDQYLARVYQLASQRFHLVEWDTSILRKLNTLEGIYEKISDRASTVRLEVLEWIIIILILISIVLPFIPGLKY